MTLTSNFTNEAQATSLGLSLAQRPTFGAVPNLALGSTKLSLANLKKTDLSTALSSGSSLSALAQTHLQGKPNAKLGDSRVDGFGLSKLSGVKTEQSDGAVSTTPKLSLSLTNLKPASLSLSSALKPKTEADEPDIESIMEPMEISEPSIPHDQSPTTPYQIFPPDEYELNEKLLPRAVSKLGQIVCSRRINQCHRGDCGGHDSWSLANQIALVHPSLLKSADEQPLIDLKRFDFLTPSPDDIVLAKQKGAFTRTGESKNFSSFIEIVC